MFSGILVVLVLFLLNWEYFLFAEKVPEKFHLRRNIGESIRMEGSKNRLIELNSSLELNPTTSKLLEVVQSLNQHCPIGHFGCTENPKVCIPQAAMCNGIFDCEDHSDEFHCLDPHDDNYYNLRFPPRPDKDAEAEADEICKYNIYLILENEFVEIHSESNSDDDSTEELSLYTTDGCQCIWEKFLCQNMHLRNLSIIPTEVEDLDLSGSTVETMDFNSQPGFPELRHLILSSCGIRELGRGPFYKLDLLQTLHLTGNQLIKISNGTFSTNVNLHKLFLGYNYISTLQPAAFEGLSFLLELDLRHNRLTHTTENIFQPLKSLRILDLSHNRIQTIIRNSYQGLEKLEVLSLSSNEISFIEKNAFEHLATLKNLYLPWNKLGALESRIFCNMYSLLDLRLNDNELQQIENEAFACLHSLQSLNLVRNHFGELVQAQTIFKNLTKLQHIQFDQFWMCWWAPQVRSCQPKGDGISTDKNLLENIVLRTCVWIMGLVGVIGNLFVIVSRLVFREPNQIHSFYIKNLALADLLMGIFLLSIAVHDQMYRGTFLSHQHSWRHSITCQFSGLLSTWSSEASVLILALITLDRYISIVRPFVDKGVGLRHAILIIGGLWLVSFLISYLPLTGLLENYFGDFYASNGLCLPLQIHNPFDPGWEYSFSLFVIVNSTAFGFISYAYWKMLRIIRNSALTLRSNQLKQDGILAKRFGLVVLTDFLCWAPVIVSKSLAMAGVPIHLDLYAWLAVFVLPVNSALNPIIYTISTKLFMKQISRGKIWIQQKWSRHQHSEDSAVSLSVFNRARTERLQTITSIQTSLKSVKCGNKSNVHTITRVGVPATDLSLNV